MKLLMQKPVHGLWERFYKSKMNIAMIEKELTLLSSYGDMLDEHYRNVADFILSCQCIAKEYFDRKSHSKEDRYNIFRIISNLLL